MSNRPRRRQQTGQRKRLRAAAITAARASGCRCSPDVRHLGAGHLELAHDDWCPMTDHNRQAVIVPAAWRPPHPTPGRTTP